MSQEENNKITYSCANCNADVREKDNFCSKCGFKFSEIAKDGQERSMKDSNKSIQINPNVAEFYHDRGIAKFGFSDYNGSIEDFTKAIEIDSSFAVSYFTRGLCKMKLGDDNGMCLDLKKAAELGISRAAEMVKDWCK